jgi:hypothetical protein
VLESRHSCTERSRGVKIALRELEAIMRSTLSVLRTGILMGVFLSSLVLMPRTARAQTSGIAGVARDTTGAVLPGVTVEASSPVLIEKVRTAITDSAGEYKIVDLLSGTYTVTFTLPGFATFRREGIELVANFTASVNGDMRVGALQETVTVSGQSPLVDTQNAVSEKVVSRELLFALPVNRELGGFAAITPGATISPTTQDVGGNVDAITQYITIHGTHANDMRVMIDGMRFNAEGTGRGQYFNPIEATEVGVELGGQTAEYELGGAQVNLIPKEGGNRFTGTFVGNYTNNSLEGSNASAELVARNDTAVNAVDWIYDVNAAVGGPIKKDKLWFYTAHRAWGFANFIATDYFNATEGAPLYTPDKNRRAINDEHSIIDDVRFTYQASQRNKLNFAYEIQNTCGCHWYLTALQAPEAVPLNHYANPNYNLQAKWSFPATNKLLFEAADLTLIFDWPNFRQPGTDNAISILEASTNYRYNAALVTGYGHRIADQSNQRFTMSYVTGSHAFKAGLTMQEGWHRHQYGEPTDNSGNVDYTFFNQRPLSLTEWATPITLRERLKANVGVFAQDQWTRKRLTITGGLRFDYFNAFVPAQTLPAGPFVPARSFAQVDCVACWKDIDPRLGAAYDLFGNGRTAIKASIGRYAQADIFTISRANNPVQTSVNNVTRTWQDANGDFIPNCDLTNPAANGECGAISNNFFGQINPKANVYAPDVLTGFGNRPYSWQAAVSMQHQLASNVSLNAGYYRTWYGNFYTTNNVSETPANFDSYCLTAPANPGLPGGGGYPICGFYDVTPSQFGVVKNVVSQSNNFGKQFEHYNGFDLNITARVQSRLFLAGGTTVGRTETNNCAVVMGNPQYTFTNALSALTAPRQSAYCDVINPWSAQLQFKFSAAYTLPRWDVQVAGTFQSLPGIPDYATYVALNSVIAPSLGRNLAAGSGGFVTADLIAPYTRFENRYSQLDLRFSKTFRIGSARVQGMMDIYNTLNGAGVLAIDARYGPTWLLPTNILAARLFKFGAQVNF